MAYTYAELKSDYIRRDQLMREEYYNFFEIFEELYNKDEIKLIYLKNLFNSEKTETIIFFSDKILKVTRSDLHYNFEEFGFQKVRKELFASKGFDREVKLKLFFDDNIQLVFDSLADSNNDWQWEYGQDIKELFKIL